MFEKRFILCPFSTLLHSVDFKGSGEGIPKIRILVTYSSRYSYSVYRRIIDYYNGGSDAYDMRKPLKRDKNRKTVRANGENIRVDPSEVW